MARDIPDRSAEIPAEIIRNAVERMQAAGVDAEEAVELVRTYGYLNAKAQIYLRKGPEAYRRDDFFHVPRAEWDASILAGLDRGFRQLVEWKGLTADRALEGIDMSDLYRIMEVGHFRLIDFSAQPLNADAQVGIVTMRHRMYRPQNHRKESSPRTVKLHYKFLRPSKGGGADAPKGTALLERHPPSRPERSLHPEPLESPGETFGYTIDDPIRCWEPLGELDYMRQLRCPNGHAFSYHRIGSTCHRRGQSNTPEARRLPGDSSTHGTLIDIYELECSEGEHTAKLYFGTYDPQAAERCAPRGLLRDRYYSSHEENSDDEEIAPGLRPGVEPILRAGFKSLKEHRVRDAEEHFTDALRLVPASAEVYCHRANARWQSGMFVAALDDWAMAITVDQTSPAPYIRRGESLVGLGVLVDAIADFTEALRLDPQNLTATFCRIGARRKQGDLRGEFQDLERALGIFVERHAFQFIENYAEILIRRRPGALLAPFDEINAIPSGGEFAPDEIGNRKLAVHPAIVLKALLRKRATAFERVVAQSEFEPSRVEKEGVIFMPTNPCLIATALAIYFETGNDPESVVARFGAGQEIDDRKLDFFDLSGKFDDETMDRVLDAESRFVEAFCVVALENLTFGSVLQAMSKHPEFACSFLADRWREIEDWGLDDAKRPKVEKWPVYRRAWALACPSYCVGVRTYWFRMRLIFYGSSRNTRIHQVRERCERALSESTEQLNAVLRSQLAGEDKKMALAKAKKSQIIATKLALRGRRLYLWNPSEIDAHEVGEQAYIIAARLEAERDSRSENPGAT